MKAKVKLLAEMVKKSQLLVAYTGAGISRNAGIDDYASAKNSKKPGVKVLPSGLQFEVIYSGEGRTPLVTSNVVTHYHGTFVDGDVFDSSIERGEPAEFPVNRVIPGWTEALQLMKEGDKWRLVLPPDIAYGEKGAAGGLIPPNSVLVFEVELIEVKG